MATIAYLACHCDTAVVLQAWARVEGYIHERARRNKEVKPGSYNTILQVFFAKSLLSV